MNSSRCRWITPAIGVLVMTTAAGAQSPHPHHDHGDRTGTTAPHLRVDAFLREAEEVIASGRGFGMAFAADQNGYPGPTHALELRESLGLTPAQVTTLETLTASMFEASRPGSRVLLDAEARLRKLFADGRATAGSVEALVREIERARADLRLVHLRAHLQTFDVLTPEQRRRYTEIRWGAR